MTTVEVTDPVLGARTVHQEFADMPNALMKWVGAFYAPCRNGAGVESTLAESGGYAAEWAATAESGEAL